MPTPEIAATYLAAHQRIDHLVRPLGPDELSRAVPACPGWTVHSVVSHLAATPEWAAAGRLRGLPSDEDTAAQVAELADVPTAEVLDRWATSAPGFAELAAAADIWPAAIDAVTHEHDIRHGLGRPGDRDTESVTTLAGLLLDWWSPSRAVEVVTPGRTVRRGPDDGDALRWTSTDFEVLRVRLGRRSRAQLAALDWSSDPGAVLDELTVFPPSDADIDE
jgi:uncharacterized protein (TIGR03083 family)